MVHFDDNEIIDPAIREVKLFVDLAEQIDHAIKYSEYYSDVLGNINSKEIIDREGFARLPVLRKADLVDIQMKSPPFGGLLTNKVSEYPNLYSSPGPIYEPQGKGDDYWRVARALFAAGFRPGDIVHNSFSYHLTPAGQMLSSGAQFLGCSVIPAGPDSTEQQVQVIKDLRPNGYTGIPDDLKILLDKANEIGSDASSLTKALVSGSALPSSLRQEIRERGVEVSQCYATAEAGLIAYETHSEGVLCEGMIIAEGIFVEIVRPGTGDPVPDGEVGELLVSTFNRDYPLIRFSTGDLSAILPGKSPCGRTNKRLKGWLGRADQKTKIKGMFVSPEQISTICKRHPEIIRARLLVNRKNQKDEMVFKCETEHRDDAISKSIIATIASVTKLKSKVELLGPDALPNDGKVIDDQRSIE